MKNMKIGARIMVGFGCLLCFLFLVTVISTVGSINTLSNIASVDAYSDLQNSANNVMDIYNETRMSARIAYNGPSESAQKDYSKQVLYLENRLKVLLATIQGNPAFAEFRSDANQFSSLYQEWRGHVDRLWDAHQTGELTEEELSVLSKEARRVDMRAREVIADISLDVEDLMARNLKGTAATGNTVLRIVLIVSVLALLLAVASAITIVSSIRKPLGRIQLILSQMGRDGDFRLPDGMAEAVGQDAQGRDEVAACTKAAIMLQENLNSMSHALVSVADGDLTTEVTLRSERDNIGISLSQMLSNLNQKFSTILQVSQHVYGGAQELQEGSRQLSSAAEQQQDEVERLSASIASVTEKAQQNTGMAGQAAELAQTIQHNAHKGSEEMGQMMNAVDEITQASQSISKIIKVIDDIAFQTNILALNAAVEAARAGQHGKGFAVVAEEVRGLASKSAEAARETASLIENSIKKASLGADIAQDTAQSLEAIVEGIKKSNEIVGNIAQASTEQTDAILQIRQGVEQVSAVVQQTSVMARQSASASEAISDQAALLENLVGQFKLQKSALPGTGQKRLFPQQDRYIRERTG